MMRCFLLAGILWLTVRLSPVQAADASTNRMKSPPGAEIFSDPIIRKFRIAIAEPDLTELKKDNRKYVRATVTQGDKVFKDVGVHLKCNGSFQPLDRKPCFSVKFDRYTRGQKYLGLSKFMLNNSAQDGTFLAEFIATGLFRDAGVPAARITHAFVELNGRDLGLYVLLEAENKDFLSQYFKNTRGNLYEAYLQDIDQRLDQDNGKETSQADLKALFEVTKEPNAAERWKRLNQVMDVDRFISFTVLEMFVSHTDGYAFNRNNFRLYHDPYSDRMTFLTHGIDWAFGNPGISIRPPLQSLVVKAVLQTPEGRRLYRERVPQLFTNCFRVDVLTNRVNQQVAKLKAAARNPNEAREFENYGANLRNMIVARAKNIAEQLAVPEPEPLKFDAAGMARLPGWRIKTDSGAAKLETLNDAGKSTLHINANKAACVASWRSRVQLAAGKYRFEGKARAAGVVPQTTDPGIGAGLRISGGKRTNKISGDADWTALAHEFEVLEGGEEVDLVCELRAQKGEVWFESDSLKLIRQK